MTKSYSVRREVASNEKMYEQWGKDTWPVTGDSEVHAKELHVQSFPGLQWETSENHRTVDMITTV